MRLFSKQLDTFLLHKGKVSICLAFCANFLFEWVTEVSSQTCYRLSEVGTKTLTTAQTLEEFLLHCLVQTDISKPAARVFCLIAFRTQKKKLTELKPSSNC